MTIGRTPNEYEAAPLGTVKDFLNDLKSDISIIQSFEDFEKDRPYLLGWINNIELLLGLKEESE